MNFSAFADSDWDIKDWINDALAQAPEDDPVDEHISALIMKMQILSQNLNSSLEESMYHIIDALPRTMSEMQRVGKQSVHLKSSLADVVSKLDQEMTSNQSIQQLSNLDVARKNMLSSRDRIQEALNWSSLERNVVSSIETGDSLDNIASDLASMRKSKTVLENMPGSKERTMRLKELSLRFEDKALPLLSEILDHCHSGREVCDSLKPFVSSFRLINKLSVLEKRFADKCVESVHNLWRDFDVSQDAPHFDSWLSTFYDESLSLVLTDCRLGLEVFPESDTITQLVVVSAMSSDSVISNFISRLEHEFSLSLFARAFEATGEFVIKLFSSLENAHISWGNQIRINILENLALPYLKFFNNYSALETKLFQCEIASCGLNEILTMSLEANSSNNFHETVKRISELLPDIFKWLEASAGRSLVLSDGGLSLPLIHSINSNVSTLITMLIKYISKVRTICKIKHHDESLTVKRTNDSLHKNETSHEENQKKQTLSNEITDDNLFSFGEVSDIVNNTTSNGLVMDPTDSWGYLPTCMQLLSVALRIDSKLKTFGVKLEETLSDRLQYIFNVSKNIFIDSPSLAYPSLNIEYGCEVNADDNLCKYSMETNDDTYNFVVSLSRSNLLKDYDNSRRLWSMWRDINTSKSKDSNILRSSTKYTEQFVEQTAAMVFDVMCAPMYVHFQTYVTLSVWKVENIGNIVTTPLVSQVGEAFLSLLQHVEASAADCTATVGTEQKIEQSTNKTFSKRENPGANLRKILSRFSAKLWLPLGKRLGVTGSFAQSHLNASSSKSATNIETNQTAESNFEKKDVGIDLLDTKFGTDVESTKSVDIFIRDWLNAVAHSVVALFLDSVLQIDALTDAGALQVSHDAGHLLKIFDAFGIPEQILLVQLRDLCATSNKELTAIVGASASIGRKGKSSLSLSRKIERAVAKLRGIQ